MRVTKIGTMPNSHIQISHKAKYVSPENLKTVIEHADFANQNCLKNLYEFFSNAEKEYINIVYKACLDPNNCPNNDALKTLMELIPQKTTKTSKSKLDKIKILIGLKKENINENGEKKELDYWIADFVKNLFSACRDKNGYLNGKNLSAAIDVYKSAKNLNELLFPLYIEGSKDENGIITDENIEFLKTIYKTNEPDYTLSSTIGGIKEHPIKIDEAARNIIYDNIQYFQDDKDIGIRNFINYVLIKIKSKNRDKIINFANKNLKYLINETGNDVKYSGPAIFGLREPAVEDNLYKITDLIKQIPAYGESPLNTCMLENSNGRFSEENIKQYERLHTKFKNDEINMFCWKQGFYIDNKINPNFVDYAISHPDKTKALRYNLAKEIGLKSFNEIVKEAEATNLFEAKNMIKLLKELKENDELSNSVLQRKINNWDSLLFQIADVARTQASANEYEEMISILKNIKGIIYNSKDKNGISFLEKVINAENFQLLDLIKSSAYKIEYDPMLEYAYNGVRNKDFTDALKEIKMVFPLLEQTAHKGSIKAFEKAEHELNSPLCHRKEVLEHLWHIASCQLNNKKFCNYFAQRFAKELPDSIINNLNKM